MNQPTVALDAEARSEALRVDLDAQRSAASYCSSTSSRSRLKQQAQMEREGQLKAEAESADLELRMEEIRIQRLLAASRAEADRKRHRAEFFEGQARNAGSQASSVAGSRSKRHDCTERFPDVGPSARTRGAPPILTEATRFTSSPKLWQWEGFQ